MHSLHFSHGLYRALAVEAFARANVHQVSDFIQLLLAVYRQVCAFGHELANQAVNILVAAALPRAVRVAEVNRHAHVLRDLGVLGQLPALIVGHALAHRQRNPVKRCAEALHCRPARRITHFHQHQIAACSLNQGADQRSNALALDQIARPMTRHRRDSTSGGRT